MSDFQTLDFSSYDAQDQSPFLSTFPPEIRLEIYAYALTEYEDLDRPHDKNTYWWRPGNTAVLRSATELLRVCRQIYNEAWLLQYTHVEHRFYLASSTHSPGYYWPRGFRKCNQMIHERYRRQQGISGKVGLGSIRVFTQLYLSEVGDSFQHILNVPYFYPRHIAVTIRYSDTWFWNEDEPLHVSAIWVDKLRLPESVTSFTVDFEMVERRKNEVNFIANEAVQKWSFERRDGSFLTARTEDTTISTWTGSSILNGRRWVRDEIRPEQLDYHVVTVSWKLHQMTGDPQRPCPDLELPQDFVQQPPPFTEVDFIAVGDLKGAQVPLNTPGPLAWHAVQRYLDFSADEESDTESESESDDDDE